MPGGEPVYLEVGHKRVFAAAVDWPGWTRAGRDEAAALEALTAYASRFAPVAERAGLTPPAGDALRVVERLAGSATTDYGAPGGIPEVDRGVTDDAALDRACRLLEASWAILDSMVAAAPAELRKGPRGGGRDRDPMVAHVLNAEVMYARKVGVRHREIAAGDVGTLTAFRAELLAAIRAGADDDPRAWPPRYCARRAAWHVLDHAWEIEDRRSGDGGQTG